MLLKDLLEFVDTSKTEVDTKMCVVYGGRFQPFHKGHHAAYKWLCDRFGAENVWIATSNKTNLNPKNGDISPFNFKEKQEMIVSLYGVKPRRIVECKNPAFSPKEIFRLYKGYKLVYVSAVGDKDLDRYSSNGFFDKLPTGVKASTSLGELNTLDAKKGYYITVPSMEHGISGTKVREALLSTDDLKKAFTKFFGSYDSVVAASMIASLKEIKPE